MYRRTRLSLGVIGVAAAVGAALVPVSAFATTTVHTVTTAKASKTTLAPGVAFTIGGKVTNKATGKGINGMVVKLYKRKAGTTSWGSAIKSTKTATVNSVKGVYKFSGLKGAATSYQYLVKHPSQTLNGVAYAGSSSSAITIKVAPRVVSVTPSVYEYNGKSVTVKGTGFAAGKTVAVAQCSSLATNGSGCDPASAVTATVNSSGAFSIASFVIESGTVGTGTCNPGENCYLVATTDPTHPANTTAAGFKLIHMTTATADPNTGLGATQTVSVTGANLPPSTTITLVECDATVGGISGCDLNTLTTNTTDSSGNLPATDVTVHNGTVGSGNCDNTNPNCVVAVGNGSTFEPYGGATLAFA